MLVGSDAGNLRRWRFQGILVKIKDLLGQVAKLPSKPRIFICRPVPVPGQGNYGINEAGVLEESPMIDKIAREMQAGSRYRPPPQPPRDNSI
jgi:hypothetical protein